MTVCQYFLQGRCRYGQNCRFEHVYSNDDRNTRNPVNSQQLTNAVKQIVEEVILSEKGGQWPLSCFSPVKGGPNIPGWEDISPEEVRWKMYEARNNGTLNQVTLEINQWYSNAEKMRNLLKEPTMERVNLIVNVLKGKRDQSNPSTQFSSTQSSGSIFGGSTQPTGNQNIFRNVTPNTGSHGSIFGNSSSSSGNIFGGSTQRTENIFGGSSSFTNQNIFGGSSASNSFSQNAFSTPQNSNKNMFSNSSSPGSGNIFSGGSVSNINIFSKPAEGNNQSAFLHSNSSGIFSNQTSSGPLFGSNNTFFQKTETQNQNQMNVFGGNQNENIFKTQNSFSKPNNIFNTQQEPRKSIFGAALPQNMNSNQQKSKEFDSSTYSKLEDLTEDEIKSFTSATFAFGKIPLKPPPKEYFKPLSDIIGSHLMTLNTKPWFRAKKFQENRFIKRILKENFSYLYFD